MFYLSIVTILWAFSFSLIEVYLAGKVDAYFAVLTRSVLAAALFLPLLRWRDIPWRMALAMMAVGGIQLGVMYFCLYQSFLYLSVPEVLLFTIFTPIYITLLDDLWNRRFNPWYLVTATLAVIGTGVIRLNTVSHDFLSGFLLVQAANLCFAIGLIVYKGLMQRQKSDLTHQSVFAYFYLGSMIVSLLAFLLIGNPAKMPTTTVQWGVLLWLGIGASGIGYYLWNKGACMVDTGALAIMNNMHIPAGLLVNLLIWNRDVSLGRLGLGGAILLASLLFNELWVRPRQQRSPA